MAHFLPYLPAEALAKVGMVQILLHAGALCPTKLCEVGVAVQIVPEPEINHGAGF
jgi:hypothetical protein